MTTGFSHDLLLLCAAGDRQVVQGLATKLRDAGHKPKVQTVSPHTLAADFTAALEQAPLVLLAVSAPLQSTLAGLLAAESAEALEAGSWLVLQLDEGVIEGLPEAVEIISWPRQGNGRGKMGRELALQKILGLLGSTADGCSTGRTDAPAQDPIQGPGPQPKRRSTREEFSQKVKDDLAKRVAMRCSNPNCRIITSGPHTDPERFDSIGEAAHIEAAAADGPRANPSKTAAQLRSIENAIWLCVKCHTRIDKDPNRFPVAELLRWKVEAEHRAEELIGTSDQSTHPGPRLPKHTPHNLPERTTTPEHFVGRDAQLEKLGELLAAPGSRVLLTGMGGVGKSELALQHAHAQLAYYRGGIVRVDARQGFDGMAAQVIAFVRGTFPELLPEKGPPEELLPLCWSQWPAAAAEPEPVLLLLDDLPSDADGAKSEERLCQGLPPRFRRLITRREKAPRNTRSLDLERLQRPDALRLLSFHADGDEPNPRAQSEPEAADGLCEAVGDLPLALVLLGARLADRPDLPLKALLGELEAKGAEARVLLEAYPELGAKLGVVESLLISWAPLSGPAQELAVLLSLMAPAVIPWELVERCRRDDQELVEGQAFGDAQAELLRAQLLERVGPERYQLHPLVRQFVALQARQMGSVQERWRPQLAKAVAAICREKFDDVMPLERQAEVAAYVPHIVKVAEVDAEALADDDLISPFTALGRLSNNQANFSDAMVWHERGLKQCEQRLGPEHPHTAAGLAHLAWMLQVTNRLAEAEPLLRRALEITEASYGPDHPYVATSLNNLAQLLQATNRLTEAEPLMRRALAIDEASYGPQHPDVATSLNNLALLLQDTNRLAEAEPLLRRALAIDEASYGPEHPIVAIRLNNLAQLLQATNRLTEAEPLMRRALEVYEASYGPEHPKLATSLNILAELLKDTNRLTEAEPLMRRALAIFEASYGPYHSNVATTLNTLAQLLQATNRLTEAEPLMRRALVIYKASYGPEHPDVATSLNNLALLLKYTNRLTEAEPLLRRALAIYETSYGPEHPKLATSLNNLAALLQETNRLAEAEPLMARVVEIFELSYGKEHPNVATALNNLAQLLKATNRLTEAEPLMRRALEIDEASYGPDHPKVAIRLNNLALLVKETNRPEEAEPLMRRALAIDEASYGPDHPSVASSLNNLAQLLQETNRLQEAETMMLRSLEINEASYGHWDPRVSESLSNLAQLLQGTNRIEDAELVMRRSLQIQFGLLNRGSKHPSFQTILNNYCSLLEAAGYSTEDIAEHMKSVAADYLRNTKLLRLIELTIIESLSLGHRAAGTEHLLLAILGEKSCRTAKILLTLGIDLKSARQKVLQIFGRGEATLSDTATLSPKADQILRCACETGVEADPTDLIVILLIDGEPNAASVLLERLSVDIKNLKNSLLE